MHLSNDLLRMRRIIYNREHAIEAEYLGLYLITYLNKIQLNNFSTQYSRFYFEEY
jgi:hypothetical protein